ncbi:siderophore-interacting protein [Microterricola viridarii]|uniref:NADPH-dependent ferric siderophore reductase, contains FAD-binding and SIP domains n=1 Tax=Microterricola viridarii TaxID=412690 RepID=A0A1H1RDS9_9MICO|nr:siderophore-interacting protein [Microterricola viridarii]SDS33079.1 NADPH-dependent ferric siderophore reductase, contains FAD-binding and SIP domains [Microterricola viridarii]
MKPSYRQFDVTVAGIRPLSPNFTRVTFTGPELHEWGWYGADQRIKVVLPGEIWRTYTIRAARAAEREVDVDFVTHGLTGPATRWLHGAAIGDALALIGPDATSGAEPDGYVWRPGAARTLLLAADETAVPAVATILEGLPADATGHVFLEVPSPGDALPLTAPAGVAITWLPRGTDAGHAGAANGSEPLPFGGALVPAVTAWVDAWAESCAQAAPAGEPAPEDPVQEAGADAEYEILWEVPDEQDGPAAPEQPASAELYAWLAGEAGAITGLRRHLVRERGVDRKQVAFMGYWKLGRSEN